MATSLGTKNSKRRKDIWQLVIYPIGATARDSGMGVYPAEGRNGFVNGNTATANRVWNEARDNAETLADYFGVPAGFNRATSMDTFTKAKSVAGILRAEFAAQRDSMLIPDSTTTDTELLDSLDLSPPVTGDGTLPIEPGSFDGSDPGTFLDTPMQAGLSKPMKMVIVGGVVAAGLAGLALALTGGPAPQAPRGPAPQPPPPPRPRRQPGRTIDMQRQRDGSWTY